MVSIFPEFSTLPVYIYTTFVRICNDLTLAYGSRKISNIPDSSITLNLSNDEFLYAKNNIPCMQYMYIAYVYAEIVDIKLCIGMYSIKSFIR